MPVCLKCGWEIVLGPGGCACTQYVEKRVEEPPIENPQATGNCMKCGVPTYSDHGFCGSCGR